MALNVQLLRDSFIGISHKADHLSENFYDILFTKHPKVRPLFANVRMDEQRSKFIRSLAVILRNLENPQYLSDYLGGLGLIHKAYGVKAELYPVVGEVLLEAFEKTAGDQWTPEMRQAWTEAYGLISGLMMKGAGQA